MPAKKIRLIDDLDIEESTDTNTSDSEVSQAEIAEVKKLLQAIDWKLWEMYQIAKKFQEYFEIK
jgi:hypothetical protein